MFVLQQRENQELFRETLSPVKEKLESIFLNYKAKATVFSSDSSQTLAESMHLKKFN